MTVQTFAALKDYFAKDIEITEPLKFVSELKEYLIKQNPEAQDILSLCRFAVNQTFVDLDFEIKHNDTICIIPPSSGG